MYIYYKCAANAFYNDAVRYARLYAFMYTHLHTHTHWFARMTSKQTNTKYPMLCMRHTI